MLALQQTAECNILQGPADPTSLAMRVKRRYAPIQHGAMIRYVRVIVGDRSMLQSRARNVTREE